MCRALVRLYRESPATASGDRAHAHGEGRPVRPAGGGGVQPDSRLRAARAGGAHLSRPRARGLFQPADDARRSSRSSGCWPRAATRSSPSRRRFAESCSTAIGIGRADAVSRRAARLRPVRRLPPSTTAARDARPARWTCPRMRTVVSHRRPADGDQAAPPVPRRRRRVVAAHRPHAVALVAGDGELRAELEALRGASLGIADRVRFLGWRRDLATIYGATDVFLLTSRNEGTPVALIEAMASAVPGVSTDVGGVKDVIDIARTSAVLAPFGDADGAGGAVNDAARRPGAATGDGRAGARQRVAALRHRSPGRRHRRALSRPARATTRMTPVDAAPRCFSSLPWSPSPTPRSTSFTSARLGHGLERSARLPAGSATAWRPRASSRATRLRRSSCPEVIRTPGYPAFVARGLPAVRHRQPHGRRRRAGVRVCRRSACWSTCSPGARPMNARRRRRGGCTALFSPLPYFGALVLTELWTTFVATAAMLMALRAAQSGTTPRLRARRRAVQRHHAGAAGLRAAAVLPGDRHAAAGALAALGAHAARLGRAGARRGAHAGARGSPTTTSTSDSSRSRPPAASAAACGKARGRAAGPAACKPDLTTLAEAIADRDELDRRVRSKAGGERTCRPNRCCTT